MVIHAALPIFFNDTLNLSYKEMTLATSFCKGIGFAMATPFWAKLFQRIHIFRFCSWVTLLAAIFPVLLYLSILDIRFLWAAYLAYGIMQGGSELSWHLSGPVFSPDSDSSIYSQTNILAQGVRGVVMPYLGFFLTTGFGASWALLAAILFCLLATKIMSKAPEKSIVGT